MRIIKPQSNMSDPAFVTLQQIPMSLSACAGDIGKGQCHRRHGFGKLAPFSSTSGDSLLCN
jgi:hypothetical protein